MKKFLVIVCCIIASEAWAQLKVVPTGNVGIGTNNPASCTKLDILGDCEGLHVTSNIHDWGRALYTTVKYELACSYHLFNNFYNQDVFYVCGNGKVWAWQGYSTGSDKRFKRDIKPIETPLETILKLNGYKYR